MAFGGVVGIDNLKIGYDTERDQCGSVKADDDILDVGDDLLMNETFASTSVTVTHDHAGNLVDDGVFVYRYDAWNRPVPRSSTGRDHFRWDPFQPSIFYYVDDVGDVPHGHLMRNRYDRHRSTEMM